MYMKLLEIWLFSCYETNTVVVEQNAFTFYE